MPIVEFNGLLSWCLDANKTGESTKCPILGRDGGGGEGVEK